MIRTSDRTSFTLVELLVAMVVASMLAAAALVALYGAQEEARDARTRAQIAKINELLARHWSSYTSRKVNIAYAPNAGAFTARERQLARLLGVRDLMRMEMPDRRTDLTTPAVAPGAMTFAWGNNRATKLYNYDPNTAYQPHLFRAYQRRISANWTIEWQNAECLYLIIATLRDEDSSGLDYFRPSEIGDTDRDGMPELLDGWGVPINFLRWAPGFESEIQPNETIVNPPARDLAPDHLDPLKVDPAWPHNLNDPNINVPAAWKNRTGNYLLFPLVYSAGPDNFFGIFADNPLSPHVYVNTTMPVDPYAPLPIGGYIGDWVVDPQINARVDQDNITNHMIAPQ